MPFRPSQSRYDPQQQQHPQKTKLDLRGKPEDPPPNGKEQQLKAIAGAGKQRVIECAGPD